MKDKDKNLQQYHKDYFLKQLRRKSLVRRKKKIGLDSKKASCWKGLVLKLKLKKNKIK